MPFEHVLRRRDDGQAHHRVLGHLVEQRVDGIAALARFAGDVAGRRRHAQPVHHDDPVRHAVEQPRAVRHVRARLAEEQALREVSAGQLDLAVFDCLGVARERIEALAVVGAGAEQRRVRVEPAQQPVVDVGRLHAAGFHARVGEAAHEPVADRRQRLLGGLAAPRCGRSVRAPVDHHSHAPDLAAPRQPRHRGVLEQPAGLGNGAQVVPKETQVEVREGAALGARPHIVGQPAQVGVPGRFVLGVELHHPRVLVEFVERVLQRVLQCIACLPQPGHLTAFGADRGQFEEARNRLAVFQQHALGAGQVLHPRQQVGEGRCHAVERLQVRFGGRRARLAAHRAAGLGNAVRGQRRDMLRPGVIGIQVGAGGRDGLACPGQRPSHQ